MPGSSEPPFAASFFQQNRGEAYEVDEHVGVGIGTGVPPPSRHVDKQLPVRKESRRRTSAFATRPPLTGAQRDMYRTSS